MINTDKSVPDDRFSDGLFEQYQQSGPSSVGRAVVQARRRLGLSQQEVADGTQLSRQQLSRMETGKIQRFNPELMKELFEYLELPSPETFQEDELSPKVKRAISLLRSQGAHLTEAGANFVDSAITMALTAIDPTIVIEPIDHEKVYVGNNAWMWQMRPFATHLFQKLRREVDWDRLTIQSTMYVRPGSDVTEYPETYTQGVANYITYLNRAVRTKYGQTQLDNGGLFNLAEMNDDITKAIVNRDGQPLHVMLVNTERNRQLSDGSADFRGTVKLYLYRREAFTIQEWEIVRNEAESYFAEVDKLNDTLKK